MFLRLSAALIAVMFACSAQAATVTYYFSANNKSVQGNPDALAGFVAPSWVSGFISFDDTAAPISTDGPSSFKRSFYQLSGFGIFTGGGLYRGTSLGRIVVIDSEPGASTVESFIVSDTSDVTMTNGAVIDQVNLSMTSTDQSLLTSSDVPSLSQLQSMLTDTFPSRLRITYKDDRDITPGLLDVVTYDLSAFSLIPFPPPPPGDPLPSSVPLPAGGVLLLSGAAVFVVASRRRYPGKDPSSKV